MIEATVTNVDYDMSKNAYKVHAITRTERAHPCVIELIPNEIAQEMAAFIAGGNDLTITIGDYGQIIDFGLPEATPTPTESSVTPDSSNFHKVAEAAVAQVTRLHEADAKILEQIQVVARAVAEHDTAISVLTRKTDPEIYAIATFRRESEAELNRLMMNRINGLSKSIRNSGLYD